MSADHASAPAHDIRTEFDVSVPMRDGTVLRADVYRPTAEGRYPVLVERVAYERIGRCQKNGEYHAARGYVFVAQSVRGCFGSGGKFTFCGDDAWGANRDGYDTVEWAASQPWSTGKVALFGGSYSGGTQYMAAPTRPPHLSALYVREGFADMYRDAGFRGGAYYLHLGLHWNMQTMLSHLRHESTPPDMDAARKRLEQALEEIDSWYNHLPLGHCPPLEGIADEHRRSVRPGSARPDRPQYRVPRLAASLAPGAASIGESDVRTTRRKTKIPRSSTRHPFNRRSLCEETTQHRNIGNHSITLRGNVMTARTLISGDPESAGLCSAQLDRASEYVQRAVEEGILPLADVLVARSGRIACHRSFVNPRLEEQGYHLNPDSLFYLASFTKPLIATLIMQQVERGSVSLARPVADYIPEFGQRGKEQVTVRHLLCSRTPLAPWPLPLSPSCRPFRKRREMANRSGHPDRRRRDGRGENR